MEWGVQPGEDCPVVVTAGTHPWGRRETGSGGSHNPDYPRRIGKTLGTVMTQNGYNNNYSKVTLIKNSSYSYNTNEYKILKYENLYHSRNINLLF